MTNLKSVIAIDGPAGAGKSTIARKVAQEIKYIYIDTGAMYRAVAWKVLQCPHSNPPTKEEIIAISNNIVIKLAYDEQGDMLVLVGDTDVSKAIRTPEVTALVSKVAAIDKVRAKMVEIQRKMAKEGHVIMDGRDIGTCVLPDADLKIFLTANVEERAQRRAKELIAKGYDINYEEIKADISARDKADMEREISPLRQAEDAILLDTTNLSIAQVITEIINLIKNK